MWKIGIIIKQNPRRTCKYYKKIPRNTILNSYTISEEHRTQPDTHRTITQALVNGNATPIKREHEKYDGNTYWQEDVGSPGQCRHHLSYGTAMGKEILGIRGSLHTENGNIY